MAHFSLIVDSPNRDLKGLVLLGCELVAQGHKCSLVPMGLIQEVFSLSPDVVVLNYVRTHSVDLVNQLHDAGIVIAVLDTEGGVFASLDHVYRTFPPDRTVREKVGCYFCWGKAFADAMIEREFYSETQIVVTGSPRFDFYASPWNTITTQLAPVHFDKPMVLINGTFPLANPRFQSRDAELNQLVQLFGYERETALGWQRTQDDSILAMIEMTKRLAKDFPNVDFVFRPHPFEGLRIYHDSLQGITNVMLGNEGTVDGWLLQAKAVIHRNCSTAIEAGFCGVPALLPRWLPVSAEVPSSAAVSLPFDCYDDLANVIRSILQNTYHSPLEICQKLSSIEKQWFTAIDGKAFERVAEKLLQIVAEGDSSDRTTLKDSETASRQGNRFSHSAFETIVTPLRQWARRIDPRSGLNRYRKSSKRFYHSDVSAIVTALKTSQAGLAKFADIHTRNLEPTSDLVHGRFSHESIVLVRATTISN